MRKLTVLFAIALFMLVFPVSGGAGEIKWEDVGSTKIVLFYPGVVSWEFLTSQDHRLGGRDIKRVRKDCRHCHLSKSGELDLEADDIVAGAIKMKRSHKAFEPEPIPGKKGTMRADVKAVYDKDYLYIKVDWAAKGTAWRQAKGPGSVPDRVSAQLNATDKHFIRYGCFISCHNDLNSMPGSPSKKEVSANPYYGKLGRDDVRLYAFYARDSWAKNKGKAELAGILKERGRIDLRSVKLEDGRAESLNGWIFDDRRWEEKGGQEATGSWSGGRYSVVFKVRLDSDDPFDVKVSDAGVLSAGFAIHADGAKKRKHYVSFPYTIGVGVGGVDITAVKLPD
ncbi:MAG: hypothetical protein BMS9Abin24_088 [Thermodesulfobacteriota bacterium]|nr:MAG: hypothetical protein BMS9Abin24_088 [Thermodesulfobacteriota bacterium]